jgi:hypothetical protein
MRHRGITFGVRDCGLPLRVGKLPVTASDSLVPRNRWAAEAKLRTELPLRALLVAAPAETVGFGRAYGHDSKEKDDDAGRRMPYLHLAVLPPVADRSRTIPSSPRVHHRRQGRTSG